MMLPIPSITTEIKRNGNSFYGLPKSLAEVQISWTGFSLICTLPLCKSFKIVLPVLSISVPGPGTRATPLIRELHWLPVQQRIEFKVLVRVYNNYVNGSSPIYLQDLLRFYNSGRQGLRSSKDLTRLAIPITKRSFGDRSFAVLGPRLWNNLPITLRAASNVQCFKKNVKTCLFPQG